MLVSTKVSLFLPKPHVIFLDILILLFVSLLLIDAGDEEENVEKHVF